MADQILRRQSTSPFDPKSFYTLLNDNAPNLSLSNGIGWTTVNLTTRGAYSSENWQIYSQQGRYFIRNYDFGIKSQLGLDGTSGSKPKLLTASGALGQQWSLIKEDDGWILTNGLLGNSSYLAVPTGSSAPEMQSNKQGAIWQFVVNSSAGSPKDPSMLVDLNNFEVSSSPLSSATRTATTSATATTGTTTVASVSTTPTSITSATSSQSPSGSSTAISGFVSPQKEGLQAGAIAGIVVGSAVLVLTLALLGFLLWRRKKKKNERLQQHYAHAPPQQKLAELADTPAELYSPMQPKETYAYRAELG